MKIVFADAGYWIALVSPGDEHHARAREVSVALGKFRTVTSELGSDRDARRAGRPGDARRCFTSGSARNGRPEHRGGTPDRASIPSGTDVLPGTDRQELEPG